MYGECAFRSSSASSYTRNVFCFGTHFLKILVFSFLGENKKIKIIVNIKNNCK